MSIFLGWFRRINAWVLMFLGAYLIWRLSIGGVTGSTVLLIGITSGIFFFLAFEVGSFLYYMTQLSPGYNWPIFKILYFTLGVQLRVCRETCADPDRVHRRASALINQPRYKTYSSFMKVCLKGRFLIEVAAWLEILDKLDRLETEKSGVERDERRTLRLMAQMGRIMSPRSINKSYSPSEERPVETGESIRVHLKDLIHKVPDDLRPALLARLSKLGNYEFGSREFRREVRQLKQMIAEARRSVPKAVTALSQSSDEDTDTELPETATLSEKPKSLPNMFNWMNDRGAITYSEHFRREFSRLREEERHALLKQICLLADHGPRYASLKTKKIEQGKVPNSPTICFVSRGAREVRFSWTKSTTELHVHFVFYKSDRTVGYNSPSHSA